MFHLNFAITLLNHGDTTEAKRQFMLFNDLYSQLDEEQRNADPEVQEQRQLLARVLIGNIHVLKRGVMRHSQLETEV
jgi:hypothetical protein